MNTLLSLERFNDALQRKGWTMKKLAEEYDQAYPNEKGKTIYNTLRKWNGGKGNPTLKKLVRICNLLECDVDYLIGRMEEHTHANQFIHDQTGLSEAAIDKMLSITKYTDHVLPLDFLLRSDDFELMLFSLYGLAFNSFTHKYADLMLLKDASNLLDALAQDSENEADAFEVRINKSLVHITDNIRKESAEKARSAFNSPSGSRTFDQSVETFKHQLNRTFPDDVA